MKSTSIVIEGRVITPEFIQLFENFVTNGAKTIPNFKNELFQLSVGLNMISDASNNFGIDTQVMGSSIYNIYEFMKNIELLIETTST